MQKTSGKIVKNLLNLLYDYDEIVKKVFVYSGNVSGTHCISSYEQSFTN